LEEIKATLEQEKLKVLNVLKDTEHNMSKVSLELNTTQSDVQKLKSSANQKDDLEKELQARMNNEMEERERVQQELHQVKKQVNKFFVFFIKLFKIYIYPVLFQFKLQN